MATADETIEIQTAEFDSIRNDLYWSFWAGSDGRIRWTGYNDAYWWNNVSKSDHARTRVGKDTGRSFVIDFETGKVAIYAKAVSQ